MGNGRQTPVIPKGAAMLKIFLMMLLAVVRNSAAAGWAKVADPIPSITGARFD